MNADRIDRALKVLGYLSQHPEGRNLKQLSDDLGLPMSSTHDLLQAMVEIGAVRLSGPRTYLLGARSVSLSLAVVDSISLRNVARPQLETLSVEIGENVYLAMRSGDSVTYVDRVEASQLLSVVIRLGGERPLHSTSVGKLMAAFNADLEQKVLSSSSLPSYTPFTLVNRDTLRSEFARIRAQGYSMSDGESVEGIIGLSTPIFDHSGQVPAAIHVSAPHGRLATDRRPFVIDRLQQSAAVVSRQLGADEDMLAFHAAADR
jgi:DNA-binding IclR family transcriptional regulator